MFERSFRIEVALLPAETHHAEHEVAIRVRQGQGHAHGATISQHGNIRRLVLSAEVMLVTGTHEGRQGPGGLREVLRQLDGGRGRVGGKALVGISDPAHAGFAVSVELGRGSR